MKKNLMRKVAVTANVTYENNGQMEVSPVFEREIFEKEMSFRARVKRDKHGNTKVTPVQEGRIGCRYDVLLDTSCGCVKATTNKLVIQLAFSKKLGHKMICELLENDMDLIMEFLHSEHMEHAFYQQRA